jgi:hypothetical protein
MENTAQAVRRIKMGRSKKAKLQLSKTTLSALNGGGYKYSGGKGGKGKGTTNGEIYPKAGMVEVGRFTRGCETIFETLLLPGK